VASLSSFIGIDGTNATLNAGRMLINLKPRDQRDLDASGVIRRLEANLKAVPGIQLYMQPVQDLTIEDHISRTQYQFMMSSPNADQLADTTHKLLERLGKRPELSSVASDLMDNGRQAWIEIDRETAGRLGVTVAAIDAALYDAFGQRLVSTIFTQSNQYRVVLEVAPRYQKKP
jgi:multidrug efflux pump